MATGQELEVQMVDQKLDMLESSPGIDIDENEWSEFAKKARTHQEEHALANMIARQIIFRSLHRQPFEIEYRGKPVIFLAPSQFDIWLAKLDKHDRSFELRQRFMQEFKTFLQATIQCGEIAAQQGRLHERVSKMLSERGFKTEDATA